MVTVRSSIKDLSRAAPAGMSVESFSLSHWRGILGSLRQFRLSQSADFVIIGADVQILWRICALAWLLPKPFKLVVADLVLSSPQTLMQRLKTAVWRVLLLQVDRFIVHQHDLHGYTQHYGIRPDRSTYVPFKVNIWEDLQAGLFTPGDGGHLLCVGRSHRDFATFIKACEISGVPAMLARPSTANARLHGTALLKEDLPANLKIVAEGDLYSWMQLIANCRALVLPISEKCISAAGASTMLDAMALGKPVIIADCPATRGVVSKEQVALCPAGDPFALAVVMQQVFSDADLRERLGNAGRQFVSQLEGELRLHQAFISVLLSLVSGNEVTEDERGVAIPLMGSEIDTSPTSANSLVSSTVLLGKQPELPSSASRGRRSVDERQ